MKEAYIKNINQAIANSFSTYDVLSEHDQYHVWDDYNYLNFIGEEWEAQIE